MCRPHGTAFLPLDVCRRKESKKEQKKEKERKEKKSKKQPHSNWVSHPSSSSLSDHPTNQPPDHPLLLVFIIEKSHDLDAELELGLPKKKRVSNNQQPTTNNQPILSVYPGSKTQERTYTSPDNDHVHTPNSRRLSAPQSFRLRRDNMSNVDKVPTPFFTTTDTNTLASFNYDYISFVRRGYLNLPKEQQVYYS